ncbi:MAG: hypothetical protein C4527_19795 [Candidatus Omnitrophota bacterium]|jgi:hypothetical protein|nr:MAG: hypothetical protein C4527_19795 [Candidatus Omnitrophota bacterium]
MLAQIKLQEIVKKLHQLQTEREHVLSLFSREETLVAGTYAEILVRCGIPTCYCHERGGHLATRISRWVEGKLKTKIVRVADREWVKKVSEQYKAHKNALKHLRDLHKQEVEMLTCILEIKTIDYG